MCSYAAFFVYIKFIRCAYFYVVFSCLHESVLMLLFFVYCFYVFLCCFFSMLLLCVVFLYYAAFFVCCFYVLSSCTLQEYLCLFVYMLLFCAVFPCFCKTFCAKVCLYALYVLSFCTFARWFVQVRAVSKRLWLRFIVLRRSEARFKSLFVCASCFRVIMCLIP